ncbi:MAG: hypothetical protein ACK5GN_10005 [Pseudomonadota bacterium]|jgi:hypothetical protein
MNDQYGKLEEGLLQAMKAIDNQVARAMQRSPAEREAHGVQKWEPYASRVESIAAFLLQEVGDESIGLDSLLVSAQAFAKALRLLCDDLGEDGLGKMRAAYCLDAMDKISRDAQMVASALSDQHLV